MKSFDLKFSGNENENAELFLEELIDCIDNSKLDKKSALKAVPRMLSNLAKKWYQGEKAYIHSWSDFKKKFRKRFVPYHDDGDVYEDLHGRTQGEGERIAEYINNIKLIAAYFKAPPSEKVLVKRTIRNLLPSYRTFIRDKRISTFDKLQKYGQKYERELDERNRYTAPKPKELMHIKYAAFTPKEKQKAKTAATKETVEATIVNPSNGKKTKKKSESEKPDSVAANSTTVQPTTSNLQTQRKPFLGTCKICGVVGHRAFHCPKRDGRVLCYGCAEFGVLYPNCTRCQSRREAAENLKKSTELSPTSAQ